MAGLFSSAVSKASPFGAGVDLLTHKKKQTASAAAAVAPNTRGLNVQRSQLKRQMPTNPAVRNLLA